MIVKQAVGKNQYQLTRKSTEERWKRKRLTGLEGWRPRIRAGEGKGTKRGGRRQRPVEIKSINREGRR